MAYENPRPVYLEFKYENDDDEAAVLDTIWFIGVNDSVRGTKAKELTDEMTVYPMIYASTIFCNYCLPISETPFNIIAPILGDADGDGDVTVLDATCIQRKLASISSAVCNEPASDTDGSGDLSIIDATYIQRWLASLPANDNIGKPLG